MDDSEISLEWRNVLYLYLFGQYYNDAFDVTLAAVNLSELINLRYDLTQFYPYMYICGIFVSSTSLYEWIFWF